MLCPGRSLAEPVPHHTGSPGAIGSAVGPRQGHSSSCGCSSSILPHSPPNQCCTSPGRASTGRTVSIVLHIVEVNPPLPPVLLQQVALGAAQVDPAALQQEKGWEGCAHIPTTSTPRPVARLRSPLAPRTSSQFCSSFTQNLARWKLPLSVRSGERNQGLLTPLLSARPTSVTTTPSPDLHSRRLLPLPILRALTVADDGSPGSPVIDAAHGLIALRARRVLGATGKRSAGDRGRRVSGIPEPRGGQGCQRGAGTALALALTQMPRVTVWSPTDITLATKAAPIVWKRSERSGENRPGDAGASGLGTRWKPVQGHRGIHPGTRGGRARKRGDRPAGAGGMRWVPARTRRGNNTRGRRPRDVGGSIPGTRWGNGGTTGRMRG